MTQIIVYGEVLFDVFPDGKSVLGGAPFNVAWNLRGLGREPLFISAVGNDSLGAQVLQAMKDWGLRTDGVYVHPTAPTGQVTVSFTKSQPSYQINPNQAYDAVPEEHLRTLLGKNPAEMIYHGSLALRSKEAKENFRSLIKPYPAKRLVDVNLRAPWWSKEEVLSLVEEAYALKINDEELNQFIDLSSDSDAKTDAAEFLEHHNLGSLILTKGKRGSSYLDSSGAVVDTPIVDDGTVPFVDSVGAGDAFCSVCLIGILEQWPPDVMLTRASSFATRVCGLRGATTFSPDPYANEKSTWRG